AAGRELPAFETGGTGASLASTMALPRSYPGTGQETRPQEISPSAKIDANHGCATPTKAVMRKRILVIDIGGTHAKLMISRAKRRKFKSGQKLTPREMVKQIKVEIEGWKFDAISIGFPTPVGDGRILAEPK